MPLFITKSPSDGRSGLAMPHCNQREHPWGHRLAAGQVGKDFPAEKNFFFFSRDSTLKCLIVGVTHPVFNRSVSDFGPHQSPVRIKAVGEFSKENSSRPWQFSCPRKLSVPRRVQGYRITDPLALPVRGPTLLWLTAWAYHLIKSSESCLDFRDGAAANQISWF